MAVHTDTEKIDELLTRGVEEVIHGDHLRTQLLSGKQLRVKLGIDPTSADVHIGRAVPLLKLKDFQELGHQIVFIVGDFTGLIGDTSDKDSERPMLSAEEVDANKKTYYTQIAKVLDIDAVEFRYNSEWLGDLTYREIGEHANLFSVADFISRDNIKRRLDAGKRVSLRETLYPLLQGYDSVAIKADVEVGGTDQRFNLLAGRTLQEHFGQEPQDVITGPLVNGLDGRKMSSSWGNAIPLNTEPGDMYGKIMRMEDREISTYFRVCTRVPLSEVAEIERELSNGTNPRDVKMRLAREITTMYHDADTAAAAEAAFVETFQKGGVPEDIVDVEPDYAETLISKGIVSSKTELRRLFEAGAIRDAESGEKLEALPEHVRSPQIVKVGKRRFVRLVP